jgi:O-methyltransferase
MPKSFLYDTARHLFEIGGGRYLLDRIDILSDNRFGHRGMLSQAFEFKVINNVPGDYFEFGLWRGANFLIAHQMKHRFQINEMNLLGFDSFEGLPEIDDYRDNTWRKGWYSCSQDEFRRIMHRRGVRDDEYKLFPGYYDRSLNVDLHNILADCKAAIVYVDCDLYTSTRLVLDFMRPYLINGTIVCFDDYYCYKGNPDQGEQKALSEFLENNNAFTFIPWVDYTPVGKAFIVRLRNGEN